MDPLDAISQELPPGAPEWIQLVPAGTFTGADGRGPYVLDDAAAVVAASMPAGRKLPIDENHSIDLVAGAGRASPARGWITALDARADGIWGRVEWTAEGRRLVEDRAYGFISPVFTHPKERPFRVAAIHRASLVNNPNLTLKSLHAKGPGVLEDLIKALGLPAGAAQADVLAAVAARHAASVSLDAIAAAANLKADAKADDLVAALQAKAVPKGDAAEAQTLREENRSLNSRLVQLETAAAKDKAVLVVDRAVEDGRIVPALRDRFIARHMRDPADVEAEIALMPSINAGGVGKRRPVADPGADGLAGSDAEVCAMMGLDPKQFGDTAKTLGRGA